VARSLSGLGLAFGVGCNAGRGRWGQGGAAVLGWSRVPSDGMARAGAWVVGCGSGRAGQATTTPEHGRARVRGHSRAEAG